MQALEMTVADDDILRGHRRGPTVIIPAALDGHVVITIIEMHILYQHITGVFGVYAIIVHQLGIVADPPADDVLTL